VSLHVVVNGKGVKDIGEDYEEGRRQKTLRLKETELPILLICDTGPAMLLKLRRMSSGLHQDVHGVEVLLGEDWNGKEDAFLYGI